VAGRGPRADLFQLSIYGGPAERAYRAAASTGDRLAFEQLRDRRFSDRQRASAFSLTLSALLRARVPLDLSGAMAPFLLHEISHAELCACVAGALGGSAAIRYQRDQIFPLPTETDDALMAAAERVVQEMCVTESWSHAMIKGYRRAARASVLEQLWARILDDEKAHAGFGWLFLDWLVPDLRPRQLRTLALAARRSVDAMQRSLEARVRKPLLRYGLRV
jgi:hypothetical protein